MAPSLLTCPITLRGDWHGPVEPPRAIIERVRNVCLRDVALHSDRQPSGLWVEDRNAGYPSIWVHDDPGTIAWIDVNVSDRDWRRLAYQFGHELGHVLCNSWQRDALPHPPAQWLEEVLVDAFSLRGLRLLADGWETEPPLPGLYHDGDTLRTYHRDLLAKYQRLAQEQGADDPRRWFEAKSTLLDQENGLGPLEQAVVPAVLRLIETQTALIADYGALNRWPERSALSLPDYLSRWRGSCQDIGAPGRLPLLLTDHFGIISH